MSWYLPTVCLILSFKQNIMTFRLGCYLMHHLKGISQLLNIVYVKHTQKEKSINLYWTLPLQGTMMRTPFDNYIYRKWHLFKDRQEEKKTSYTCSLERTSHRLVGKVLWDIRIMEFAYEIFENKKSCSKIIYSRINLVMGCYWWFKLESLTTNHLLFVVKMLWM